MPTSNTYSIHLLISGHVQGVGFRWFVAEEARRLDLAGWVRNLPNGDVELAARGDAGTIQKLEEIASKGPAGARVSGVTRLEPAAGVVGGKLHNPFEIMR